MIGGTGLFLLFLRFHPSSGAEFCGQKAPRNVDLVDRIGLSASVSACVDKGDASLIVSPSRLAWRRWSHVWVLTVALGVGGPGTEFVMPLD